jgi:hypothetical protein
MNDNSISRVHYFEGQFLRTQDFNDEQGYHVAMHRRHNIAHHTWGIVSGLELVQNEGSFFVESGMAVDGYGRELVLPQKTPLSLSAFVDKNSKALEVWLVYDRTGTDKPPAGYAGCATGNGNGNGNRESFYRWTERAQIILEKPDAEFPDPRQPKGLIIQDRDFDASRTPPDCPKSYWPVYLGQIINDPTQPQPFAVNLDNRPYAGLVGNAIDAPSGRARVQIGSERADDKRRFAVFTRDAENPNRWRPRLAVHDDGEVKIRGNTSLYGNLTMSGGAIEFEAGSARASNAPPWNIYHLSENGNQELRIEMAAPQAGGLGGRNQVVIGAWFKGIDETGQETEKFHPCLTILDNGTVRIEGDLVVNGRVIARSITPRAVSQAAQNAAASAFTSGIVGTTSRLPELSTGRATKVVDPDK